MVTPQFLEYLEDLPPLTPEQQEERRKAFLKREHLRHEEYKKQRLPFDYDKRYDI